MNLRIFLKRFNQILVSFNILTVLFVFLSCREIPTNPDNPSNSDVTIFLKTTKISYMQKDVYDSIGRPVEFIIAYIFPEYVKNTSLKIYNPDSSVVFDTNFSPLSTGDRDTLKFTKTIMWPDLNKVIVTALIANGDNKIDSATLTGFTKENSSVNNPPEFNIDGNTNIITGQTCSLTIKIVDPDVGQKYTMMVKNNGPFIEMDTTLYTWKPDDGFTGEREITFKVSDNGNPTLTVNKTVKVTVSDKMPSAPQNLRVKEHNESTVTFTWDTVANALDYRVFKSKTIDNGYAIFKDSVKQTEFIDKIDSTVSYYYVIARNIHGESKPSNIVSSVDTGNVAPEWDIRDTLKVELPAGVSYTLNLRDTCFDARDGNLAFILLPGKPDNDAITNGIYTFASTVSDTGKYHVTIIAKNKFGLADTLFLQLTSMYIPAIKDTIPPVLSRFYPLTDSISVSASEVAIKVVCKDSGGIGSVTGTLGANQFNATKTDDTLYTLVVSKLPAGEYSMLTITASDKSGNSSSIKIFIKYDPAIEDNTKPILTPVNPVITNIITANTSVDIQISCKDQSGILSVVCQKNGTPVEVKKQDPLYSATITGLVPGRTDTVRFIAIDNSKVQNSDTLIYLITFDKTLNDSTGPDIKLIVPSKDSIKISSSALSIEIQCTDISGVSSVTAEFGTSTVTATKETNNTYKANITGIAIGNSVITITAKDSSTKPNVSTKLIYVHYDPSLTDSAGPEIQLKTPANDNATIGSSSLNVEITCKDNSGIASVTCSSGTTAFPVSKYAGGIYSASVSGLKPGNNEITFTATDSSANFNKKVKKITINYDPNMGDNVPPQVSLIYPDVNEKRVFKDNITVTISCKDASGIDSVTCIFAKRPIEVKNSADSLYSADITGLTKAGLDTITFTVKDKKKNSRIFPVFIKYNTLIDSVAALTPSDGKTAVELQPTFTWSGGDDPDGETVYFKVVYGTSESSLTKETGEVTKSPAKITTNLACNTTYYWQVVAFSKSNTDISKSKVLKFTTLDEAPKITKQPENVSIKAGQTATFKVTATGTNLSYQWKNGETDIIGAKGAEYTTDKTVDRDDGSTFKCVISNNAGKETSDKVTLSILHGITYNANGATSGKVPTDDSFYTNGTSIKVKGNINDLKLDGHTFSGWARSSGGSNDRIYNKDDTLIIGNSNITLYAKWTVNQVTVKFDPKGGSTVDPKTVDYGSTVDKPADPSKTGYKFGGWYKETGYQTAWNFDDKVTGNMTLYAKWTVNQVTVTFDPKGGSTVDRKTVDYGSTVDKPTDPKKDGYTFDNWYNGTSTTPFNFTTPITGDITLTAKWKVIPTYKVIYHENDGIGTVPIDGNTYKTNDIVIVKSKGSLLRTGYTFTEWNTAKNGNGTSYKVNDSFKMGSSDVTLFAIWEQNGEIKDADGNIYTEVTIGNQVWMVENFRCTKYNDGTPIPHVNDLAAWSKLTTPGYCFYNNSTDDSYKKKWGALYNWYAVDTKKLAPKGWHVPTHADWTTLENYLIDNGYNWDGTKMGNKIAKSMAAKTDWLTDTTEGAIGKDLTINNRSKFSALPGGYRSGGGGFGLQSGSGDWWSATEYDASNAYYRNLYYYNYFLLRNYINKSLGFSVRLLRD